MSLVDDDVGEGSARQFLMHPCGREIHVARNGLAAPDQDLAEQMLGAAPLMSGDNVSVAVILLDRRFEVVKVAASGIGLIAKHHPGPLPIAHGVGAAVGEQIDVHVIGTEQEGVVSRRFQCRRTLLSTDHAERLDHLDLPGFGPRASVRLLAHSLDRKCAHCQEPSECEDGRNHDDSVIVATASLAV